MASVTSLIVAVRATGAGALGRVGAGYTALATRSRAAAAQMRNAASPRIAAGLTRIAAAASLAARSFRNLAQRAAAAARSIGGSLLSGIASAAPMMAKWGVIIGGVVALLVPLVAVVGHLAGAVQLVAPAAFAAAAALVVLKFGFSGIGDALSAGIEGDAEKFREALKKLTPTAQQLVKSLLVVRKSWTNLRRAIQEQMFVGVGAAIEKLNTAHLHNLATWLPRIADQFNDLFRSASNYLSMPAQVTTVEGILRNTHRLIGALLGALKPLGRAFLDIASVAAPALADIGGSIESAAEKFATWIRQMKDSGKLAEWIQEARDTFRDLGAIGEQVGRVISGIFKGGEASGKPFLQALRDSIKELADWIHSDNGQEFVRQMGDMGVAIAKVGTAISWLSGKLNEGSGSAHSFGDTVKNALAQAWNYTVEVFRVGVISILTYLGWMVNGAAAAFGWIPGLGPKLEAAAAKFNSFVSTVNNYLEGLKSREVNVDINYRSRGDKLPAAVGSSIGSGNLRALASGGPVRRGETAWVGESGPELVTFGGAGRVHSARASARMAAGGSGGNTYAITVQVAPGANLADAGRAAVEAIKAYERTSGVGWRR